MRKVVAILGLLLTLSAVSCGRKDSGVRFEIPPRDELDLVSEEPEDVFTTDSFNSDTYNSDYSEPEYSESYYEDYEDEEYETTQEDITGTEDITEAVTEQISEEFTEALKLAQMYSDSLHLSRQSIYVRLSANESMPFSEDAVQYALENIDADFSQNALESARVYKAYSGMSNEDIFALLKSDAGDRFTESEAQYAVEHLD